jgi:cell fate regulator YaaT (PSP1 superfamily)
VAGVAVVVKVSMTEEQAEEAPSEAAPSIVGVRFKEAGRVFYFDAGGFTLEVGQSVVVQTPQGSEVGKVVISHDQLLSAEISDDLNPVLRIAGPDDFEQAETLRCKTREDLGVARKKVEEHGLAMRLIGGDCALEGSQLTLYFIAEQRVDFRNLVRDLSSSLGKRVQLIQVGERDRAKLAGGIGQCGYSLCCRSWLTSFPSISIRMAKDQDVPLNPSKISGVCGRLLCCLAFEHEHYRSLRGQLPKIGQTVSTPAGNARLIGVNVPRETVTLQMLDTFVTHEMPVEELRNQYGVVVRPADIEKVAGKAGTPAEEAQESPPEREVDQVEAAEASQGREATGDLPKRKGRRRRRRSGRGRKSNNRSSE